MTVISLPLTFTNSFWSQDYRTGLHVLYRKLDQSIAENQEIVDFIRARSDAEAQLANSLINLPPSRKGTGFNADDGASLLAAFSGLRTESVAQGSVHGNISRELATLVADPFEEWAKGYKNRVSQNKTTMIDLGLRPYEQAQADVAKLKQQYLTKTRRADDAEDDVRFAPVDNVPDKYTNSPRTKPADGHRTPPQRSATVSERIAARFKELQKKGAHALNTSSTPDNSDVPALVDDEKPLSRVDKGKGKEKDDDSPPVASPPPMPPLVPPKQEHDTKTPSPPPLRLQPIPLSDLSFEPSVLSQLLRRAEAELPLRPVKIPLLGEYQDTFTGKEFANWLKDNAFNGNFDHAVEVAEYLTETEKALRLIGGLGNQFEPDDTVYQFRSRAFNLEHEPDKPELVKRTGAFVNFVSKALGANGNGEPAYVRARQEAEEADRIYRIAIRKLDQQRLALEQRIEETLKVLQRWELERLRAVKTVLLQFQGTLANLPKAVYPSIERQATLIAAYQPESDLTALIEYHRTGPFRPSPQVYESVAHEEFDVVFGIDLRKWAEGGWFALTSGAEKKGAIPPVVTALLKGLDVAFAKMDKDNEAKHNSWIYEVPLHRIHRLRNALNAIPPDQPIPDELLDKFDAPVLASTIKLWALELDPPLALYDGWDEFRKLYPSVGSSATNKGQVSEEQRLQNIASALQRLPRVHLYVLDAIVKHLRSLIDDISTEESKEILIDKFALSVGRTILRPKQESKSSIQDRHPTLFFIDLLKNYSLLLPPAIARKKRESERKVPIRKRTAPIDMRFSTNRLSMGGLTAQQVASLGAKAPPPPSLQSLRGGSAQLVPPPPPPPLPNKLGAPSLQKPQVPPPPVPPVLHQSPVAELPPRPQFKEPPPEAEDLPPRPNFKEPLPEGNDDTPPRPQFAEPNDSDKDDSEDDDSEESSEEESEEEINIPPPPPPPPQQAPVQPKVSSPQVPPPPPNVLTTIPPTSQKRLSGTLGGQSNPGPARTPTPSSEDVVLGTGKSTITRAGSGQNATSTTGVRGPRLARGGRAGGNVQNLVSSINRNSMSGSSSPQPPNSPNKINRLSGSPVRRPSTSSVVSRSAASFSRRTMASDAEDDVVERK